MRVGENTIISPKASLYGDDIEIGDNCRIDDFCILSGKIRIGNNVHVGAYSSLVGKAQITLRDRAQLGQRVYLMSSCDDFSGRSMVGPCVPENLRNVTHAEILLDEDSVVGTGSVVFPGVTIGENT